MESRTIPIHMIKSTSSLERFQFSKVENEFKEVKGLISSFSKDHRNLVFNRYASFRGIDGISGRDEEVWAPILIIAETLDAEVGSLFIKESMLALAKKIILQKKRTQLIGNVEAQILEATQVYVDQVEPLAIDGISLYVGADLWRSVKDRCSLPGLKIETVSRVLKRNGIIMDIRRPRLPIKGQKSCYQLDKEKLLKITAEYS